MGNELFRIDFESTKFRFAQYTIVIKITMLGARVDTQIVRSTQQIIEFV
jgi:hypothetical protein